MTDRSRVLIAGDTHGNIRQIEYLLTAAYDYGVSTIVQVGDFGYWPGARHFADDVDALAVQAGVEVWWLDGNHENFDALERDIPFDADEPQQMRSRLWYLPRGATWTWEGCRFMALGGAYSIDQAHRTPHVSWWPQEVLNYAQIDRAKSRGPVDVMLTHDAPDMAWPNINLPPFNDHRDQMSQANRRSVQAVVDTADPALLVHGHYHMRYTAQFNPLRVEGLSCDGDGRDSWMVIEPAKWGTNR